MTEIYGIYGVLRKTFPKTLVKLMKQTGSQVTIKAPDFNRRHVKVRMKFLIGTLLLGLAVAIPPFDRAPTITLNQNRDAEGGIPSISIAFPDGYADNMILNKVDEEEMEENECIFMGHLETETSACIAITGCPGIDNVELTIFSKHAERSGVMKWSKDGSVELVDRAKLDVPRPERLETPREDDDWEVDGDVEFKQADVDSMLDIEEGCPNGTCADKIQRTHVLTYKVNFSSKLFRKSYFIAVSL